MSKRNLFSELSAAQEIIGLRENFNMSRGVFA
jgi:hypothetical protein